MKHGFNDCAVTLLLQTLTGHLLQDSFESDISHTASKICEALSFFRIGARIQRVQVSSCFSAFPKLNKSIVMQHLLPLTHIDRNLVVLAKRRQRQWIFADIHPSYECVKCEFLSGGSRDIEETV